VTSGALIRRLEAAERAVARISPPALDERLAEVRRVMPWMEWLSLAEMMALDKIFERAVGWAPSPLEAAQFHAIAAAAEVRRLSGEPTEHERFRMEMAELRASLARGRAA
jgi:hypothetical protein